MHVRTLIAASSSPSRSPHRSRWRRRARLPRRRPSAAARSIGRSTARSALYDTAQLQRGFKIYREVCSTCHSLKLLAFRNLADPGGPSSPKPRRRRSPPSSRSPPVRTIRARCSSGRASWPITSRRRSRTIRPRAPRMAARCRRTCPCSPRRAATSAGFPWFIFDAFTQYQEDGPDYIHAILNGYEDPPRRLHAAAGRAVQQIFPGPRHRHAEAALRRPGRIYRRHAGDGGSIRPRTSPRS